MQSDYYLYISNPIDTDTMKVSSLPLLSLFLWTTSASAAATVYLIRHGEKPSNGSTGLSAEGEQRAQCLRTVFGAQSSYDIGYIMAQTPKSGTYNLSTFDRWEINRLEADDSSQTASGTVPTRPSNLWPRTSA